MTATVTLKPGRDGPLRAGHPWIFSGAIARIDADGRPGSLARIIAADGSVVGVGYVNTRCSITVRMLSRALEEIDALLIRTRLEAALSLRRPLISAQTTAYRLVNGEGDFLPGVVVDVYGDFVVCQYLTAGAELLKPLVVSGLVELLMPRGIYEKSEGGVRQDEGLANAAGALWGEDPPPLWEIVENGCRFVVNISGGQKTGFFLDQRDNRLLAARVASGKRILNGFSYSGGFGIFAGQHEASHVVSVDSSEAALNLARRNWQTNGLAADQGTFIRADMFAFLRDASEFFDVIILDPPPFVRRRHDAAAGVKGYKEINLQAFRCLPPGGQLFTFSCSQHLSAGDFLQAVLFAAADARRSVQIVQHLSQGIDHPINLAHAQGAYLKGLWLRMGD